jgi:hypothetical protein
MKSITKKITAALFVVPLLTLSMVFFGATPVDAKDCTMSSGAPTNPPCTYTNAGGTITYYDANGNKTTADKYNECNEKGGIGGAVNENCAKGEGQQTDLFGNGGVVTLIINVMLFVIGILCVIMIIFGGIRYTTSTGDKTRVDNAKNTIIYAVVGLVVAIIAYALVNWVFGAIGG